MAVVRDVQRPLDVVEITPEKVVMGWWWGWVVLVVMGGVGGDGDVSGRY